MGEALNEVRSDPKGNPVRTRVLWGWGGGYKTKLEPRAGGVTGTRVTRRNDLLPGKHTVAVHYSDACLGAVA